tara:strand:- start:555 stop:1148 length:594 start_codon:yes stop_codon:yes gene_type:complete
MQYLIYIDTAFSSIDQQFLNNIFCLSIAVACFLNKSNNNVLLLISVILSVHLFDILFLNDFLLNSPAIQSYMFFIINGFFDFAVLLLIAFRLQLFKVIVFFYLRIASSLLPDLSGDYKIGIVYQRHVDEFKIMLLYFISIVVNIITSLEYGVRFFVSEHVLYAYYIYTPIKVLLFLYEIYLIFKIGFQSKSSVFMKE